MNIDTFSATLQQLTEACHQLPVEEFRRHALETMAEAFNAQIGWWGMTYEDGENFLAHSSCYTGMPEGCEEMLNLTHGENLVGNRCRSAPGEACLFGPPELYGNMATAVLASYMDIQQVIAISLRDPQLSQSTFLSLARKEKSRPFPPSDASFFKLLASHLAELLKINFLCHISRMRDIRTQNPIGRAMSDAACMVHIADRVFMQLVGDEWPDWKGPQLPTALTTSIQNGLSKFLGSRISAEFFPCDRLWLVTVNERSLLDVLDRREREVAIAFAAGGSYKHVARQLGLAPATVRHYLRHIYEKLSISNKATLVSMVGNTGVPRPDN